MRESTIRVGDKEFRVRELDFEIDHEDWNAYKLLDGGRVRVKTTVARIFRVLDGDGQPAYNEDGDPHIIVRHKAEIVSSE